MSAHHDRPTGLKRGALLATGVIAALAIADGDHGALAVGPTTIVDSVFNGPTTIVTTSP